MFEVFSHATVILNTVNVVALYVGANGDTCKVHVHLASLDCLNGLASLAESGHYFALFSYAPLDGEWQWHRQPTKAEKARRNKRHAVQYGSMIRR